MTVPEGDDVLSSSWLGGVLGEPLVVRDATRIGLDYGLAGVTHRVVAATKRGNERSFVVKQDSAENVERELLFHRHCADHVRGFVPECLGGVADPDSGRGVLVLEDVAPAEQGDVLRGCSDEQAEAIVRALAQLHGTTWKRAAEGFPGDLPRWGPDPREPDVWLDRLARASRRFPEILTPPLRARLHDLPENVPTAVQTLRAGPASWIQVDAHLDNVLWRPDGTAVLLDWCNASIGPPAVDLAHCFLDRVAAPAGIDGLVAAYSGELRRHGHAVEPGELRAAVALVLPTLLQGIVGWAGREDAQLDGRPGALCERTLGLVCAWSRAEDW